MKVSKTLQDVWDVKQAAYEETKHLTGAAYFDYVHKQVQKLLPAGMEMARVPGVRRPVRALAVGEAQAAYRTRKTR